MCVCLCALVHVCLVVCMCMHISTYAYMFVHVSRWRNKTSKILRAKTRAWPLRHRATWWLQNTATHCNTLQHTATHATHATHWRSRKGSRKFNLEGGGDSTHSCVRHYWFVGEMWLMRPQLWCLWCQNAQHTCIWKGEWGLYACLCVCVCG